MKTNTNDYSLLIAGSYGGISLGLYQEDKAVSLVRNEKGRVSRDLISSIHALLEAHSLSFQNLSYIAVDTGPGAFTSLRVLLTTANALSFAQRIPLVGCNGLHAMMDTLIAQTDNVLRVVLLNAFNNEVYYRICRANGTPLVEDGYADRADVVTMLNEIEGVYVVAGNGFALHEVYFQEHLSGSLQTAVMPTASLEALAAQAHATWKGYGDERDFVYELQPGYLKDQLFKKA